MTESTVELIDKIGGNLLDMFEDIHYYETPRNVRFNKLLDEIQRLIDDEKAIHKGGR